MGEERRTDWTREELLAICERAIVLQDNWSNRDSSGAQRQVGECYALLKAGCAFSVRTRGPATNERTIWLDVAFQGFDYFELGEEFGGLQEQLFYLPTPSRLDEREGRDWY